MATKAYVLIETSVGTTKDVAGKLQRLGTMQSVDMVTGPFDIIAIVEAPDLNSIGDLVTSNVHSIAGVTRTVTCLAVTSG